MLPSRLFLGEHVSVELNLDGARFLGLGAVEVGGTPIRSGRRPMFVEIRNPSGIEFLNYRLIDLHEGEGSARLKFAMDRRAGGLMEWMVHEVRNRYNTADWTEAALPADDTSLELELRPVKREMGGRSFVGFSYQYHYRSKSVPIYKILDRGTWEPGGSATGSEFWMRNCFVSPMVKIESAEQFHSSEWFIPDCANPSAFQFLPLQTELQGYSFTAAKAGVLVTWPAEVAHVRSLFEKPRGQEVWVHLHEHCGDLSHEFTTAPVEVLFAPGERSRSELANDHESFRELVHETLHRQAGLRRERVTTYGQIEEWQMPDLQRYRKLGVPKLLAAGVKTVYFANHFENNMNTWGVGNMCCTVDYKVAESVGEDNLRQLCRDIRQGGAVPEMWANTSVSTLTHIFNCRDRREGRIKFLPREGSVMEEVDQKSAWVRNPSNALEADHYTPVFAVMNLRDESVRNYWIKCWKKAHDEVGLGGIFLDSSFNLSSDKFHYIQNSASEFSGGTADNTSLLGNYRPAQDTPQAILSQYHAHLSLMAEMQKLGYEYCNEDLGVFGTHRHGPSMAARLDNLFLWSDCIANFEPEVVRKAGLDPDEVFFRGLAYRMMWSLYWDIATDRLSLHGGSIRDDSDVPTATNLAMLRAFNEVEPLMQARTILSDETGVIYHSPSGGVLWAFEDLVLPLEKISVVTEIQSGETLKADQIKAKRHHIYTF